MPALKALLAQLAGVAIVLFIGRHGVLPPLSPLTLAILQGVSAAAVAATLRSARWWIPIHLIFMPGVVFAAHLGLPAWAYLAGFIALCLIFWGSFRTQVPLFLSNRVAVHKFAAWLPDKGILKVLDVGSGTGSFVSRLARLRPDWPIDGVEAAPAPLVLSRWLTRDIPNAHLFRGDFWALSFNDYDVVYAFLSPVAMLDLWHKARREMGRNRWLISNSFPVPGLKPNAVLSVNDRRASKLYCYQMPGQ